MQMVKLFILALCVGGILLLAWFLYPERIEQVFAELNHEPNQATRADVAVFVESISAGFALGFFLLKLLFGKLGKQEAARAIEADSLELQTVFVFIAGLSFLAGGLSLFETSRLQGTIHIALALACILYLPFWYVRMLTKKRKREQNKSMQGRQMARLMHDVG